MLMFVMGDIMGIKQVYLKHCIMHALPLNLTHSEHCFLMFMVQDDLLISKVMNTYDGLKMLPYNTTERFT